MPAPGKCACRTRGELIIPALSAEDVPAEAAALKDELAELLPLAPIASLLVELDRRTGFLDCFTHAAWQAGPLCGAEAQPAGGAHRRVPALPAPGPPLRPPGQDPRTVPGRTDRTGMVPDRADQLSGDLDHGVLRPGHRADARRRPVDDEVLAHISPAHSENVNYHGTIDVEVDTELAKLDPAGYRPLRARRPDRT
ncbi:hypothetical protein GCM10020000_09250 [Streptomyces olivoverticillatus]